MEKRFDTDNYNDIEIFMADKLALNRLLIDLDWDVWWRCFATGIWVEKENSGSVNPHNNTKGI
jgi:hypothetical protein